MSISLELFNLGLQNSPPTNRVWWGSHLKFSIALENFSPRGRSWICSISGPLGKKLKNQKQNVVWWWLRKLETGRIRFRTVRFQTPSSASFWALTELWRELNEFLSAYNCVPKWTHQVFLGTHQVCRRTLRVLSSETVLSKQYSSCFLERGWFDQGVVFKNLISWFSWFPWLSWFHRNTANGGVVLLTTFVIQNVISCFHWFSSFAV